MQDRANAEYLGVVRRNVASYCNTYSNAVQKRNEKRRKQKAVTNGMRQAWFSRHPTTSAVD